MLIKQKDDVQPTLQRLEDLLALQSLTRQQRSWIEEEIDHVRAGAKGEADAAYHIDFALKKAENWAVIHDLRLEHDGRTAQIDHLIIGRKFDIFVIESKNLKTAVRMIANGEFEVKTRYGWKGMASPVEQNKRHIEVLSRLISDKKLTPKRVGFQIPPTFRNWVLLAPECHLTRRETDDATILKMDMFAKGLNKHIDDASMGEAFSMVKLCSPETMAAFAEKLVTYHQPIAFDYAAKFGITAAQRFARAPGSCGSVVCEQCAVPVDTPVANFCRVNAGRFEGRILCRTCQRSGARAGATVREQPIEYSKDQCQECRSPVDAKVMAFCRLNSRRFNKRVLCRICQTRVEARGALTRAVLAA